MLKSDSETIFFILQRRVENLMLFIAKIPYAGSLHIMSFSVELTSPLFRMQFFISHNIYLRETKDTRATVKLKFDKSDMWKLSIIGRYDRGIET